MARADCSPVLDEELIELKVVHRQVVGDDRLEPLSHSIGLIARDAGTFQQEIFFFSSSPVACPWHLHFSHLTFSSTPPLPQTSIIPGDLPRHANLIVAASPGKLLKEVNESWGPSSRVLCR
eukprot:765489-Hanusia_phi.AAC.9